MSFKKLTVNTDDSITRVNSFITGREFDEVFSMQEEYIKSRLRFIWTIFPFNFIAARFIVLLSTSPEFKYENNSLYINMRMNLVTKSRISQLIFIRGKK